MKRIIIIVTALASTLLLSSCEDEFKDTCINELHGVIKSDTQVINTTAFDSKGRLITGTSTVTTRFCIADGKVVMQS